MDGRQVREAPAGAPEHIFVKWSTPEEELAGVARLLETFRFRRIDEANDLAILVPNMAWAVQAKRACDAVGLKASVRAGHVHLGQATRNRLALLEAIAYPDDASLAARWEASGRSRSELEELRASYGGAQASALIRLADLRSCPELAHGLLHVCGDESPRQLHATLMGQLERPTAPQGLQVAAIVPYTHVNGRFSQAFFVGCVDGLVPGSQGGAGDPQRPAKATEAEERAFSRVGEHVSKRLYYSGFVKAEAGLARRANIRFARTRHEDGIEFAVTRVTPLFGLFGADRPSTLGSQALLRMYGLN